jgi:hypothetical protein
VALALIAVPAGATLVLTNSSAPDKAAGMRDQFLLPSSNDYGWHSSKDVLPTDFFLGAEASLPAGPYLLDYGYDNRGTEAEPDFDDVIRHRRFGKAFLIILICGGLIRFFTSPTYLKFISEVFDPKAAF